jgi:hypothetical protein
MSPWNPEFVNDNERKTAPAQMGKRRQPMCRKTGCHQARLEITSSIKP